MIFYEKRRHITNLQQSAYWKNQLLFFEADPHILPAKNNARFQGKKKCNEDLEHSLSDEVTRKNYNCKETSPYIYCMQLCMLKSSGILLAGENPLQHSYPKVNSQ